MNAFFEYFDENGLPPPKAAQSKKVRFDLEKVNVIVKQKSQ